MALVWCPNLHGTMRLIWQHVVAPICFFERFVLSISDKALLLVVMDNYSARWQAEYANNIKKVST
jgi:hypothetical protein